MKKLSGGLILGFLLLNLSGCFGKSVQVKTEIRYVLPPLPLLEDCEKPGLRGGTNGDLRDAYEARGLALDLCNVDKQKLREWRESYSGKDR